MLKSVEGKAQSWKFRMAVMGVFSLVAASAVVGGRWLWASPKASEVLEGYSLEHCRAVTDSIHANMCQKQLFLVSETPALLCRHLGVGGAIEEVECCDGAQMNAEISATSGECNAQCLAQFSAEWRLDAPPFEATVYGSFEGGKCTCIDVLCIVQVEMDPNEDVVKAQMAAKKQMDTLMLSLKKDSAQLKECGTDRAFAKRVANDKEAYDSALKKMAAAQLKADAYDPANVGVRYEIPIRFLSNGIWTDDDALAEIAYVNKVFNGEMKDAITFNQENVGSASVQFVLAANDVNPYITETCNTRWLGSLISAVNPRTQVNVLICTNVLDLTVKMAGIGVFPWSGEANTAEDVTMIAKSDLESRKQKAGLNYDPLLAHELGHTLGLFHTFDKGCDGEGDEVVDTPKVRWPSNTCDNSVNACNGQRMAQNPMEYSRGCKSHAFTNGQVSRLTTWGRLTRKDLWNAVPRGYSKEVDGYLPGYASHVGVHYATLKEATDSCDIDFLCYGVTKRTVGDYSTRSGLTTNASPQGEVSRLKLAKGYGAAENGYLPGWASTPPGTKFPSIEEAMAECDSDAVCNGITLSSAGTYSTRTGTETKPSLSGEVSHLKEVFNDYLSAVSGYLPGWASNPGVFFQTLGEAVDVCDADVLCKGVTKGHSGFSTRSGTTPKASSNAEKSFRKL